MKIKKICMECGGESIQIVLGKPVCMKCGAELRHIGVEPGGGGWERSRTLRNLNRIRRFGFILNRLADHLGLTDDQVREVRRFIKRFVQKMKPNSKANGYLLVTYCIWYVLRSEGIPIALNDVLGLTNKLFNKSYKVRHINRLIKNIFSENVTIDPYIRLCPEDYIDFVINRMYLENPNVDYQEINWVREKARYISKLLSRTYPISNPRIAAGVSISIAIASYKSLEHPISIDRMIEYVSGLLGVSHHTLKRRIREATKKVGLIKKVFTG